MTPTSPIHKHPTQTERSADDWISFMAYGILIFIVAILILIFLAPSLFQLFKTFFGI